MRRFCGPLGLILACLGFSVGCDTGPKTSIHTPPTPGVGTVVVQGPSVPAALGNKPATPATSIAATPSTPTPAAAPSPTPAPATTIQAPGNAQTATDASATVAVPAPPPLPAPVADVVQLTRGGIDEGVITEYIANIREPFALGASQIVYLNDLGVSSNVIHVLMRKAAAIRPESFSTPATAQAAPTASAPIVGSPGPATGTLVVPPAQGPATAGATPGTTEGTPPPPPAGTTMAVAAPQPTTVVSQQVFYQALAPYGSWMEVPGYGWCWRPSVVVSNPTWQPYCDGGSWLWTDAGWYWNSTYTWGWAPYHYGRWHQHARFGWVWYPGYDWAPAWVAWRSSPTYCGWAPLPPECRWNASVGFSWVNGNSAVSIGFGIGTTAWYATTWDRFCDPHLYHHRLPRHHVERFVQESKVQVAGTQNVNIRGNNNTVIINNGITREEVQRHTREEIRRTELRDVNSPAAARSFAQSRPNPSGGRPAEVAVYRPSVPVHDSRPPESVLKRPEVSRTPPSAPSGGGVDRIGIAPLDSRPLTVPSGGGSLKPNRPGNLPASGLAPSSTPARPAPIPTERMTQTIPPASRPGSATPSAAAPKISAPPAASTPPGSLPSRAPESRTVPIPRSEPDAPAATLAPATPAPSRIPAAGAGSISRPAPALAPRPSGTPTATAPGASAGASSGSVAPSTPPAARPIVIPNASVPSRPATPMPSVPSPAPVTLPAARQEAFRPAPAPSISLPPSAIQTRPAPVSPSPAAPSAGFAPAPRQIPSAAPTPIPSVPAAPAAPSFQPAPRPAPSATPAPVHGGRPGQRGPTER